MFESDYVIQTPFRMIISGSSGTGKTTFVEKLITSDRIDRKFAKIYYVYPFELGDPPVSWHGKTESNVEYLTELPDARFFDTAEKYSLVVLDDLWTETCKNPDLVKAFKIFSRKKNISMIAITQSYFSGGDTGREIRNNWYVQKQIILTDFSNLVTIFNNHGDRNLNRRILERLGYKEYYDKLKQDFIVGYHYVLLNLSASVPISQRVATNLFHEKLPYVEFY